MIDHGWTDGCGRRVSLRDIGEDWRAVADIAPRDDQRDFVFALAGRYLLLSMIEGEWRSLGIYADETAVGHVMWAIDDDGSHWIGGLMVDAAQQGVGIGRAATRTLVAWLLSRRECDVVRLSYNMDNTAAAALYRHLGFRPTGEMVDDEIIVEHAPAGPADAAGHARHDDPEAIVAAFHACVNGRDIDGIAALMANDYTFIDAAGTIERGRSAGIAAWTRFFEGFPDYRNIVDTTVVQADRVVMSGHSVCSVAALRGRALWSARVRDGTVVEWRVDDDTPENRRQLGVA